MATNLLISGLSAPEQTRLAPFFERVELADGEELVHPGQPIGFVWFIESAVIFTSQSLGNRSRIPAGLAGSEGAAGFELWLGRNVSPLSTAVTMGGGALRMAAADLARGARQAIVIESSARRLRVQLRHHGSTDGSLSAVPLSGRAALPLAANDPAPFPRPRSFSPLRISRGGPAQHRATHCAALPASAGTGRSHRVSQPPGAHPGQARAAGWLLRMPLALSGVPVAAPSLIHRRIRLKGQTPLRDTRKNPDRRLTSRTALASSFVSAAELSKRDRGPRRHFA